MTTFVRYRFRRCQVLVGSDWLVTEFDDGSRVPAAANLDTESVACAVALGYDGDTWAMSRDHEIAHTWLAERAGLDYSPVLWAVAHGLPVVDDGEEAAVLRFQEFLGKTAARPWDSVPLDRGT